MGGGKWRVLHCRFTSFFLAIPFFFSFFLKKYLKQKKLIKSFLNFVNNLFVLFN